MKRQQFLIIAGVLALLFGLSMLIAPDQMLSSATIATGDEARHVVRWMACPLLAFGVMNLMARNDPGSVGLRALMIANIVMHALGIMVDLNDHLDGFINRTGMIMGTVVHGLMIFGFIYYLRGAGARSGDA